MFEWCDNVMINSGDLKVDWDCLFRGFLNCRISIFFRTNSVMRYFSAAVYFNSQQRKENVSIDRLLFKMNV